MFDAMVGLDRTARRSGTIAVLKLGEQRSPISNQGQTRRQSLRLRTRCLIGDAQKYRLELLRLLALAEMECGPGEFLGLGRDECVARQYESLWEPGGALIVAERGRRIEALVHLVPALMASAFLDRHIWTVQSLATDPLCRQPITRALMACAAKTLGPKADLIAARVSASQAETIRGLEQAGFQPACGEAIAVIEPRTAAAARPPAIRIERLTRSRAGQLVEMANRGGCHSHLAWEPGFDQDRLCKLNQRLLLLALEEPDCHALVARTAAGEPVGILKYSLSRGLKTAGRKTGSVDFIGVRADLRGHGITEALHTKALKALQAGGAQVVITRTLLADETSLRHLRTLRKIGYRLVTSNLVLHRWRTAGRALHSRQPIG